eukprot:COSAG02_NODE_40027_length_410_cov_0.601286_1_plen_76_part_00
MVFFRGKFRHVSSSSESDDDEDEKPPPSLTGDPMTESILTVGCLLMGAAITVAVMTMVLQLQRVLTDTPSVGLPL